MKHQNRTRTDLERRAGLAPGAGETAGVYTVLAIVGAALFVAVIFML